MSLTEAFRCKWVKEIEQDLPSKPRGLRVIDQQLWCCCGDAGINIIDTSRDLQRFVSSKRLGLVNDVAVMSNGDVIVASDNGLFRTDTNGIVNNHYTKQQYA